MRSFFIKVSRAILALFGVTVFTACPVVAMYATPYSDYEIKGKVVDETTDKPVQGLRVIRSAAYPSEGEIVVGQYGKDTLYTDTNGGFYVKGNDMTFNGYSHLMIEDVDSTENGLYQSKEEFVELTQQKKPKPKGWYQGRFAADVTVKVTPKNE